MEKRNVNQIMAEISEITKFKDLTVMRRVVIQNFPKSKGMIGKLERDQLEKLCDLLKEAYNGEVQSGF